MSIGVDEVSKSLIHGGASFTLVLLLIKLLSNNFDHHQGFLNFYSCHCYGMYIWPSEEKIKDLHGEG